MGAYASSDRASWIVFGNKRDHQIMVEGEEALFNQYASILISAERHPHLKHDLAEQWHEWLLSGPGQQAIADFSVKGQQLFFPNAD
jgi:tungstate transport system substrate-binding protein